MADEQTMVQPPTTDQPGKSGAIKKLRWRRRRPGRLFLLLGVLGPGLISAAAGNDAGGIATYSNGGALFGFGLLWVLIPLLIGLIVVQEMCARMGAITQKGLADLIREEFGVRWTAFAMLCLLIANGGIVITEFLGIRASIQVLAGQDTWLVYLAIPLVALGVWWLVMKGSYRRVEKVFLAMALVFLSYIPAAFLAKPDWGQVFYHTVVPTFQFSGVFITMFVATVGTTISPYMPVYTQSAVADKGTRPEEYAYTVVDVTSGSLFGIVTVFFIIVTTGATLFVHGSQGITSAADAARALEPFAGPFAEVLFAVGLFGASVLAAAVLPLSTSYAICEAFGFERGVSRTFKEAPFFQSLFTGMIVFGALIAMIPNLPIISVLVNLQILNAVLMPVLLVFVLKLVNNRRLMGRRVNGRIYNIIAWATTIIISILTGMYIVFQLILPLFGVRVG
ncbi:MAG TPA: Nramp family divalent metal transporter [Ktedonobacterales bacterium]|jgi:Mn2+/Fe2+ NRAMP family transporter